MLDIRRLRHESEEVRAALAKRDAAWPALVDQVLVKDEERRQALAVVNDLKAERNQASKEVGERKRAGENKPVVNLATLPEPV